MAVKLSRREALQHIGLGAVALGQSALLAGCGNDALLADGAEPVYTFDPDRPWWLQPPFGLHAAWILG